MVQFSLQNTHNRERPTEKGSRPTVFRRTPTFPTIAVMKNQVVATICGLITGNQLHIYLLLFGLSTTTSQELMETTMLI
ncbi:hypothetical protein HanIR_Chr04g0158321 [Helianthus annuus]|nr:hypothetical protein HanHA89_Chr14g0569181 [Helianthus annuus]KAJ0587015.1 hypothetical protein HanIR_Chr04g0158321 [Helianthus annuus]